MLAADGIFQGTLGHLFRPRSDPYTPGQSTHLTGVVITVLDTNEEGEPTAVDFRFDVPLEDASLRWLIYRDDRYVPCAPPQIGDTLRLPPSFGSLDLFWR